MKKIISKIYPSIIEIDVITGEITTRPMTRDEINEVHEIEYFKRKEMEQLYENEELDSYYLYGC